MSNTDHTDHTARPDSWARITEQAGWGDPYADLILEFSARVERLEQAQQQPEPEPADDQTLHTVALRMVDTLANLDVLPEITDTIRRAIREPMAEPAPSTPAGLVSDVAELIARFASTSRAGDDCTPAASEVLHKVADWLEHQGKDVIAVLLRMEAGR